MMNTRDYFMFTRKPIEDLVSVLTYEIKQGWSWPVPINTVKHIEDRIESDSQLNQRVNFEPYDWVNANRD